LSKKLHQTTIAKRIGGFFCSCRASKNAMLENFNALNKTQLNSFRYINKLLNEEPMLELTKKILVNVSFDRILFQKELNKAIKWISDTEELKTFKLWCIVEFGATYPKIVSRAFTRVAV
jgi:hypothetical protein